MECHNWAESFEPRNYPPDSAAAPPSLAHERDAVLAYVMSRGVPRNEAEDLVQEVFLVLYRHKAAGLTILLPKAYLRGIAANLVKRHWASKAKRRHCESVVPDALLEAVGDPDAGPAARANEAELAAKALEALDQLQSQRCKDVIRMRYWQGRTYRDIAAELGVSKRSVEHYEQRGLRLMRLFLAAQPR